MAKFVVQNFVNINENNFDKDNGSFNYEDYNDAEFIINNASNKKRLFKIGKYTLDEET